MSLLKTGLKGGGKAANSLLDMATSARMARAKEQGFDTDNIYYHGTDKDFDYFSDKNLGTYFSGSKDYGYMQAQAEGRQVIPAFLKIKKPYVAKTQSEIETARNNPKLVNKLKSQGYDSITWVSDKDKTKGRSGWGNDRSQVFVFDPSNIRSVNAVFDPSKQASSAMLATRVVPTATAGLLGLSALGQSNDATASPISAFSGVGGPLLGFTPDEARAAQIASTDTRDVGSIQSAKYPAIQRAAGLLGLINTPIGPMFESTPNVLNRWAYGEEADIMDRLGMSLELMP